MIRDITIGQYYPAKSVLSQAGSKGETGIHASVPDLFVLFKSIPGYIVATVFLVAVIRLSKVPFSYIVKA